MFKRIRTQMNYSNVIATIALFAALGTGGAYAANTIGSADVIDESLTSVDIKDSSLNASDLNRGSVVGGSLGPVADNSLTTHDVADNSLTGNDVYDGTLKGADVQNGSITGDDVNESTLGTVPSAAWADKARVNGVYRAVASNTSLSSATQMSVTATCPTGYKVAGSSTSIEKNFGEGDYAVTDVVVTAVVPSADMQSVQAFAFEKVPTDMQWRLKVYAYCLQSA